LLQFELLQQSARKLKRILPDTRLGASMLEMDARDISQAVLRATQACRCVCGGGGVRLCISAVSVAALLMAGDQGGQCHARAGRLSA
jgi:hypothetical protein